MNLLDRLNDLSTGVSRRLTRERMGQRAMYSNLLRGWPIYRPEHLNIRLICSPIDGRKCIIHGSVCATGLLCPSFPKIIEFPALPHAHRVPHQATTAMMTEKQPVCQRRKRRKGERQSESGKKPARKLESEKRGARTPPRAAAATTTVATTRRKRRRASITRRTRRKSIRKKAIVATVATLTTARRR